MSEKTKTPAAEGTTTDVGKKSIETVSKSRYHYDSTEADFCQAVIREIDISAREIYDNPNDSEASAYYAGKIQGLVYALTLIRGIKNDY